MATWRGRSRRSGGLTYGGLARASSFLVSSSKTGERLSSAQWLLITAVASAVPTVVLLLGAGWGWWPSEGVEYVAFAVNVVLLFAWGLLAARAAGRTWLSAWTIGVADALLGLAVVAANAVIK
ncbi:hypothetical protein [Streptomyces acidiscabies]|uniref:Uncharacterized protein n=1 Tax=Streptomyces acidiscabies TaxID=42234 RepID=A0AAP6EKT6_9ACTN|nr:hypothetical protein [Streptomyces acidiscabies]MBZ3909373.1 hypothetical protein [Streptomyces acidiscabies]MDX2966602.1 hypothetical protein [Streptomyces acidiscabies]MDX3019936.1 hypothetical protein [Streptomyces acidiscabies]MDX3796572.1 hypothetical protein [Streptomyces acidiscabies]